MTFAVINALSQRYFLQANDQKDLKDWVEALNQASKITVCMISSPFWSGLVPFLTRGLFGWGRPPMAAGVSQKLVPDLVPLPLLTPWLTYHKLNREFAFESSSRGSLWPSVWCLLGGLPVCCVLGSDDSEGGGAGEWPTLWIRVKGKAYEERSENFVLVLGGGLGHQSRPTTQPPCPAEMFLFKASLSLFTDCPISTCMFLDLVVEDSFLCL